MHPLLVIPVIPEMQWHALSLYRNSKPLSDTYLCGRFSMPSMLAHLRYDRSINGAYPAPKVSTRHICQVWVVSTLPFFCMRHCKVCFLGSRPYLARAGGCVLMTSHAMHYSTLQYSAVVLTVNLASQNDYRRLSDMPFCLPYSQGSYRVLLRQTRVQKSYRETVLDIGGEDPKDAIL